MTESYSAETSGGATEEVFVFPASSAQQRLWLIDQLEPDRSTYNIPLVFRLAGPLDVRALEASLDYLHERHETLRTVFDVRDGAPVQVIRPPEHAVLPVIDLSALDESARTAEVARLMAEEGGRPFDLRTGPVLRATLLALAEHEHILMLTAHHIAVDGWSLGILQRELSAAYAAYASGSVPALPELPIQYADFTQWQRERISGPADEEQINYWKSQLRQPLPVLDVPVDRPRARAERHIADRVPVEVPVDVSDALTAFARDAEATSFMALMAVYHVLIHRYSGQQDVIVGAPIAGRTRRETEGLIGFFVNTLALRVDFSAAPTFRQLLASVRTTVLGAMANQDVPFEKIVEVIQPKRDRTRNPVFQTLFSLQDLGTEGALSLPGIKTTKLLGTRETAKWEMQLLMNTTSRGFRGQLEFDADLFDRETAEQLARHFVNLVRSAVAEPDRPIGELSLLSDAERHALVTDWNATEMPYPENALIHELFEEQVERTPNADAITFAGETIDYATLDARANALAQRLIALGVGPDERVAIFMDRSIHVIVAVIAILKAGGAYLPIDPAYPPARARYMLENADVRAVLTMRAMADRVPPHSAATLVVDELAPSSAPERARVRPTPDQLAYILYTSGSTGNPKGVAMPHRPLVNLLSWQIRDSFRGKPLRTLQFSALSFDVLYLEIFATLCTGGVLVLLDEVTRRNPEALFDVLVNERIERLYLPFVALQGLADAALLRSADERNASLRQFNTAGEQLRITPSIRAWLNRMPGCLMVNQYGPTETHVVTALTLAGTPDEWEELPTIGRPIDNTTVYLLDQHLEPVPRGVTGEVYLGGVMVARGYLGSPERTAERFLTDPFSSVPGARMYRSGDLARYRPNGEIEYLGRADGQIKLRGFRIELGEVESVIARSPLVAACSVAVREDTGQKRLVAYVVLARDVPDAGSALRTLCKSELPEFMVPSAFVFLPVLPLTPSGKVDRRSLPAPEDDAVDGDGRRFKAPRTPLEHEIAQIWERLLPGQRIGIYDDFFECGGHSLLAVQMLAEIQRARGRRVPLAWLFESTTVVALAARLTAEVVATKEPPVVALQAEATGRPLAFVHGDVRGGGWYCRRLAPLAAPDSPFLILPTIGADGELFPWTIEAMAKIHVAELRKVQPNGPYRLGGFCIGGLIAFEIARQLRAAGESVDKLVIVDSSAINARTRFARPLLALLPGSDENDRLTRQAVFMKKLRWYEFRVRTVRRQPLQKKWEWVWTNVARRLRRLTHEEPTIAPSPDIKHDAQVQEFASAMRTQIASGPGANLLLMQERAASVYFPGHYDGCIDLIWADAVPVQRIDPTHSWGLVADRVNVHPLSAAHLGLVTNDLPLMAEAMRRVLESGNPGA
jgi:amino acid adenylation domain-containing protein